MARRRKSSTAEDLVELVSLMPWWGGVLLAALAYVSLHALAERQVAISGDPRQVSQLMLHTVVRGLATAGQYALPIIFLFGAALSAWRRRQRKALLTNVVQNPTANALDGISWQQFEQLVGEGFRQQGYAVLESGGGGPDGGVDLVLTRGRETFLVQCKQWRAFKIGVDVVRELYGVMAARGAAGGFVVTSGRFTEEAKRFASGRNVKLIDGPQLQRLLAQGQPSSPKPPPATPAMGVEAPAPATPRVTNSETASPACPVCAREMVQRVARKGAHAGRPFWGCTAYPSCRGTQPVD